MRADLTGMDQHPAVTLLEGIPDGELPTVDQIDYLIIMVRKSGADRTSDLMDSLLEMRSAITQLEAAG